MNKVYSEGRGLRGFHPGPEAGTWLSLCMVYGQTSNFETEDRMSSRQESLFFLSLTHTFSPPNFMKRYFNLCVDNPSTM